MRCQSKQLSLKARLILRRKNHTSIFRLRCQWRRRGAGNRLQLLDQGRVLFEQMISKEDELVSASIEVRDSLFVRAELRSEGETMRALTNPIYFRRSAS